MLLACIFRTAGTMPPRYDIPVQQGEDEPGYSYLLSVTLSLFFLRGFINFTIFGYQKQRIFIIIYQLYFLCDSGHYRLHGIHVLWYGNCLLYTSDAADDLL